VSFRRTLSSPSRDKAFSLIEIVISLSIIATALLAVIGFMPLGAATNREAAEETIIGIVLDDARQRLQGHVIPTASREDLPPVYYDGQGHYLGSGTITPAVVSADRQIVDIGQPVFRVETSIQRPLGMFSGGSPNAHLDVSGVRYVTLQVFSPIDPVTGASLPASAPRLESVTFAVGRMTGTDWEQQWDTGASGYKPRIEF